MKAKKTSAKATSPSKVTAKKSPAEPKRSGAIKTSRPAAKAASPAVKAPPPKAAKSAVGKVKVPNKSKPPVKTAAVSSSPAKTAAAKKPAAAAPAAAKPTTRAAAATPAAKPRPRTTGAPLTEDDIRAMSDDEYMNDAQLEFFRLRLLQMRQEVLQRELDVKERLHEREVFADPADRATAEEEHWLDLRLRERESLLLKKIDDTLRRIEAKEYGYCEKTGDPIGIPRLLARPTATVSVDIKGQDERVEAQYRDR